MAQDNKFIRSLIESAKQGNSAALEQLFEMNLSKVYGLSFLLTGDKLSAELLTINTLINAWEFTDTIYEGITFTEWIKNVTIHVALNELKKQNQPAAPKKMESYELIKNFPSSSVTKAYQRLSNSNKFILTLNFIENYSADDISEMINIDPADIAMRITDSVKTIIDGSDEKHSIDTVLESLENFPTDIVPEQNLLKYALNKIHEMKFEDWEKEEKKALKEEIIKYKKEPEEKKQEHKIEGTKIEKEKVKLHFNKKFLIYPVFIAILITVFLYFFSDTTQWTVVIKTGKPKLNNRIIESNIEFLIGDRLQTNEFSEASLDIPAIGRAEVLGSTILERLDGNYSAKLLSGKLIVKTDGAEEFFQIEIPGAVINEFYIGTEYILQTDERGNSTIELLDGWLQLTSGETEIIFPVEHKLKILKGAGAGLPFLTSSTTKFIKLLDEYMFGKKSDIALKMIVESASTEDGITLWNLFCIVKPGHRLLVYDKLYEIYPHSDEIKKEDVLTLDKNMIYAWLEEIEWQM